MPWSLVVAVAGAALVAAFGAPTAFIVGAHWRWSDLDATAKKRVLRSGAKTGRFSERRQPRSGRSPRS